MARRRRKKGQDPVAGGLVGIVVLHFLALGWGIPVWSLVLIDLLVLGLIGWAVLAWQSRKRAAALAVADLRALSPRELELHVATVIDTLPGWTAKANRGTADQGADVIAVSPGGVRVAVQVKQYSNPVGNKAVQEVVASKAFYQATAAVVVTAGPGFTRAAQQLAQANNVKLWQPDDLLNLQQLAHAKRLPPPLLLPA
ncbi:restriction endonuclease [Deinococcus sonorensis]|uniref:Restriction endonuclease n=1 Tax=Deinococcus sonorensis TaxID=309891 RepID=A0ABV8YB24_9DEIO